MLGEYVLVVSQWFVVLFGLAFSWLSLPTGKTVRRKSILVALLFLSLFVIGHQLFDIYTDTDFIPPKELKSAVAAYRASQERSIEYEVRGRVKDLLLVGDFSEEAVCKVIVKALEGRDTMPVLSRFQAPRKMKLFGAFPIEDDLDLDNWYENQEDSKDRSSGKGIEETICGTIAEVAESSDEVMELIESLKKATAEEREQIVQGLFDDIYGRFEESIWKELTKFDEEIREDHKGKTTRGKFGWCLYC